jgi:erythrin-vacuolar iron transport family protein
MIRREVEMMEEEARNFYRAAIAQTSDAAVRQLLGDLAAEESKHYDLAEKMDEQQKASGATNKESESERRRFVLQIVQPGLAGLMDGSVSTLAPVFAAAFATHTSKDPSSLAWPPLWEPGSAWVLRRQCQTTACLAGAAVPGRAGRFAVS